MVIFKIILSYTVLEASQSKGQQSNNLQEAICVSGKSLKSLLSLIQVEASPASHIPNGHSPSASIHRVHRSLSDIRRHLIGFHCAPGPRHQNPRIQSPSPNSPNQRVLHARECYCLLRGLRQTRKSEGL